MTKRKPDEASSLPDDEAILRELRQLDRLLSAYPNLTEEEVSERMATTKKTVKHLIKLLRR